MSDISLVTTFFKSELLETIEKKFGNLFATIFFNEVGGGIIIAISQESR